MRDKMKLGIVGSRQRNSTDDYFILLNKIKILRPEMIISGGCHKGADNFAERIAKYYGISILICYPNLMSGVDYNKWEITEAMYARNRKIADECDHLIALVSSDRKGGTEYTVAYFRGHYKNKELEIL